MTGAQTGGTPRREWGDLFTRQHRGRRGQASRGYRWLQRDRSSDHGRARGLLAQRVYVPFLSSPLVPFSRRSRSSRSRSSLTSRSRSLEECQHRAQNLMQEVKGHLPLRAARAVTSIAAITVVVTVAVAVTTIILPRGVISGAAPGARRAATGGAVAATRTTLTIAAVKAPRSGGRSASPL